MPDLVNLYCAIDMPVRCESTGRAVLQVGARAVLTVAIDTYTRLKSASNTGI